MDSRSRARSGFDSHGMLGARRARVAMVHVPATEAPQRRSSASAWKGTAMLRYAALALSLGAWMLRPLVIGEQFAQSSTHGFVFLLASFAQGAYALVIALRPWLVDATGGRRTDQGAYATGRAVYLGGAVGNALLLALDCVTRLPVAAPLSLGVSAAVIMAVELALALVLLRLARLGRRQQ